MTRSSALERRAPSTAHEFDVRHHALEGGGVVIEAAGELDLATAPALKSALLELLVSGERRFLLDLAGVTHMDSTGLAVLIGFQERMLPEGSELVLTASEAVRLVFRMTGVDRRFALCLTVEEALAAWGTAPVEAPEVPGLSEDAAMAVGLASTALPFAENRGAEVQRWLRILRSHGDAGRALRSLELTEAPREALETPRGGNGVSLAAAGCALRVDAVVARAKELAMSRGARAAGTGHLLEAVIAVYGAEFDWVLRMYGGDREALLERLTREGL